MEFWKKLSRRLYNEHGAEKSNEPAWLNYESLFTSKWDKLSLIRDHRFVILDTETTGLDYRQDRILSIGAIGLRNFEMNISDRFEYFLHHENYVPGESIKIHGIMNSRSLKGLPEKEMLIQLLAFCRDSIIVGHHIGFDIAMLNQAMKKHFGASLKNKTVDTGVLAHRLEFTHAVYPVNQSRYSLDTLCEEYRIPPGKRHTASGDAFITGILFLKLLARLERRGVTTLRDLIP